MTRNPIFNAQSLLIAREEYYGNRNDWYSIQPPEYEALKELSPIEQVAGQVYYSNKLLSENLSQVSEERYLSIDYEKFCLHPSGFFQQLIEKMELQGYSTDWTYRGPMEFSSTNAVRLPDTDFEEIAQAFSQYPKFQDQK